jgi:hypothetical protein
MIEAFGFSTFGIVTSEWEVEGIDEVSLGTD